MVLVADIGNTNINFGIFKGKTLKKSWNIPSAKTISIPNLKRYDIKAAIICSVVPKITKALKKKIKELPEDQHLVTGYEEFVVWLEMILKKD